MNGNFRCGLEVLTCIELLFFFIVADMFGIYAENSVDNSGTF